MNSRRDEDNDPTGEVERMVYESMSDLGWVIPQTEKDVERAESAFNNAAEVELPERLRDPYAAFDRLCTNGAVGEQAQAQTDRTAGATSQTPVRVFGSLIQLLRREKSLTLEKLAEKARVDINELINIEQDPDYEPRPRTVHQLAGVLGLPKRTLVKLSNLTHVHDDELNVAAVRFAARSSTMVELSREERRALAEFVYFLVSHDK
jgi:transcriptional regulator with XRE-family HTH domain